MTDDFGSPINPQYRVIEKRGNWVLLYDQLQVGDKVRHEFRIVSIANDVLLYPGISLNEAQKRFDEITLKPDVKP